MIRLLSFLFMGFTFSITALDNRQPDIKLEFVEIGEYDSSHKIYKIIPPSEFPKNWVLDCSFHDSTRTHYDSGYKALMINDSGELVHFNGGPSEPFLLVLCNYFSGEELNCDLHVHATLEYPNATGKIVPYPLEDNNEEGSSLSLKLHYYDKQSKQFKYGFMAKGLQPYENAVLIIENYFLNTEQVFNLQACSKGMIYNPMIEIDGKSKDQFYVRIIGEKSGELHIRFSPYPCRYPLKDDY